MKKHAEVHQENLTTGTPKNIYLFEKFNLKTIILLYFNGSPVNIILAS